MQRLAAARPAAPGSSCCCCCGGVCAQRMLLPVCTRNSRSQSSCSPAPIIAFVSANVQSHALLPAGTGAAPAVASPAAAEVTTTRRRKPRAGCQARLLAGSACSPAAAAAAGLPDARGSAGACRSGRIVVGMRLAACVGRDRGEAGRSEALIVRQAPCVATARRMAQPCNTMTGKWQDCCVVSDRALIAVEATEGVRSGTDRLSPHSPPT